VIFLYIIVSLVVLAGVLSGGSKVHELHKTKQTYGISRRELHKLSTPAHHIMRAYHELPATNRPNGNMVAILTALDKKNGGDEEVSKHFTSTKEVYRAGRYVRIPDDFSWGHANGCAKRYHNPCQMTDYNDIYDGLKGIAKDLADQAYEIEMAGIAGRLGEAKDIVVAMEQERDLIRDSTRAIKRDVRGELA